MAEASRQSPIVTPVLTAVREGHRFDEQALEKHLRANLTGFEAGLQVFQFEGGQSNPTFVLRSGDREVVLRKKPPGKLLKSAHQVDREYRVMRALRGTGVPVPEMHLLCEDESVIGTAFFVMEYVQGRVVPDSRLPGFSREQRSQLFENVIQVLAAIHAVDPTSVGLGDFGRPGNYYERQISRWTRQYEASKTSRIESMERLMEWLPAHVPETQESRVVHGDFRIGNCILHPTEPRVLAVLDWELSTLGHPLADLAYLCQSFHGEAPGGDSLVGVDLAALGIPDEATLLRRYCELSGREAIENWSFYIVFQMFRSAAIVQGVYKRGLDGNASSQFASEFGEMVKRRADSAWQIASC